jgi:hypothetical protein
VPFLFFYQIVMTQQLNLRLRYNFNLMGNRQHKKPEHAVVAVTEGLLDIMNREENDEIVLHPPAPGRSNCTAQRHPPPDRTSGYGGGMDPDEGKAF